VRALLAHRFLGQLAGNVVVVGDERVLVAGQPAIARGLLPHRRSVAGVRPPVSRGLARGRHHAGHEDQRVGGEPIRDQGRGEPTERLTDDDQILPVTDRLDDGVGVVPELRGGVIGRKVRGHHVVPARAQLRLHQVPVPADVAGSVDQHEGAHGTCSSSS
jgi:hypothetical protein